MKVPFSNSSEADWWVGHNCRQCWRASRMKEDGSWTKGNCKANQEILDGYIIGEVSDKTYELTRGDCPRKELHRPPRKKKDNDKSLSLF